MPAKFGLTKTFSNRTALKYSDRKKNTSDLSVVYLDLNYGINAIQVDSGVNFHLKRIHSPEDGGSNFLRNIGRL